MIKYIPYLMSYTKMGIEKNIFTLKFIVLIYMMYSEKSNLKFAVTKYFRAEKKWLRTKV